MKKGRHWPFVVAGLLALAAGANVLLLVKATGIPSFAVEQDYYEKAQAWDEKMAQDRRNAALGWDLTVGVETNGAPTGERRVLVALTDRDGEPLEGARIRLETFHNARAAHVLRADLSPEGPGRYSTLLPLRRPGLWELRLRAERDGTVFTRTVVHEIPGAP